jgi:hypothetical protein
MIKPISFKATFASDIPTKITPEKREEFSEKTNGRPNDVLRLKEYDNSTKKCLFTLTTDDNTTTEGQFNFIGRNNQSASGLYTIYKKLFNKLPKKPVSDIDKELIKCKLLRKRYLHGIQNYDDKLVELNFEELALLSSDKKPKAIQRQQKFYQNRRGFCLSRIQRYEEKLDALSLRELVLITKKNDSDA